jgi:hypothetical protein
MIQFLRKFFEPKRVPPQPPTSGIVGPFGKYAFATYDLDAPSPDNWNRYRLEVASSEKLTVLRAVSAEAEREYYYCGLLSVSRVGMVLDNLIGLRPETIQWFQEKGREASQERFGIYPVNHPGRTPQMSELNLKALELYGYLSGLSRKKRYSVGNTPKSITSLMTTEDLLAAYKDLEAVGLLKAITDDFWEHAATEEAVSNRELMKYANSFTSLLDCIEYDTSFICREIEKAKEFGWKLYLSPTDSLPIDCPICERFPAEFREVPITENLLIPFHYQCGSRVPRTYSPELRAEFLKE